MPQFGRPTVVNPPAPRKTEQPALSANNAVLDVQKSKSAVVEGTPNPDINASTDLMGNRLLGLHGNPPRSDEPTYKEVQGAIPPIRNINGARVWTANRFSAVDATFDNSMSNFGAGTPSPAEARKVLSSLKSNNFDHEGLIGDELPILLLNFPYAAAGEDDHAPAEIQQSRWDERRKLEARRRTAVAATDWRAAADTQELMDALDSARRYE